MTAAVDKSGIQYYNIICLCNIIDDPLHLF